MDYGLFHKPIYGIDGVALLSNIEAAVFQGSQKMAVVEAVVFG